MALADYSAELLGWLPSLDVGLANLLVNRAWRDIREARLWSWLRGTGVLVAPQNITTGKASVVQFSLTVTLDTAANAALNNLSNPIITLRQFRSGQGPVYNIAAYNNGGATLTLDRPYMEATAVGQSYQCYRCYYQGTDASGALVQDFLMFSHMANPIDGYAIVGENLRKTRAELDHTDPTRGAQDVAYVVASYNVDANGIPVFELWPHPTSARAYTHLYRRRGLPLSATVDIPSTMSKDMLITKALDYAYDWAIVNQGRFPALKGVNFQLAKAENNRKYRDMLRQAMLQDDNIILDSFIVNFANQSHSPIDSKFAQSHDVDWL